MAYSSSATASSKQRLAVLAQVLGRVAEQVSRVTPPVLEQSPARARCQPEQQRCGARVDAVDCGAGFADQVGGADGQVVDALGRGLDAHEFERQQRRGASAPLDRDAGAQHGRQVGGERLGARRRRTRIRSLKRGHRDRSGRTGMVRHLPPRQTPELPIGR